MQIGTDPNWSSFENVLIHQRYAVRHPETQERLEKTYEDVVDRMAHYVLSLDMPIDKITLQEAFKHVHDRHICLATPAMMNLGNPYVRRKGYYSCFPLGPIPDSTQEIFEYLRTCAAIFQYAGGVGLDYSLLRPAASPVDGFQGQSSGPCGFVPLFASGATCISQGGKRRGAMLGQMDYAHKDILDFIALKRDRTDLSSINLSVNVFGDFWKKKDLIREIANSMWISGDPGLLFSEEMANNSPYPSALKPFIKYVNPCGEYTSLPWSACNLLTVNALACEGIHDFEELGYYATCIGNAILWITMSHEGEGLPIESQHFPLFFETLKKIRPVGIGTSGVAEYLYSSGKEYDDIAAWKSIFDSLARGTLTASSDWATATKTFVEWDENYKSKHLSDIGYEGKKDTFWNTSTLCQAPTGSVSQFLRCIATGIEPLTTFSVNRQYVDSDTNKLKTVQLQSLASPDRPLKVIDAQMQLKVISNIQSWLHTSASKTIMVPKETTVEDIEEIIWAAKEMKLKGLTVFREGCRLDSIVSSSDSSQITRVSRLPDNLDSKKYKFKGQSSVHIFISYDPDIPKEPKEIFIEVGKSGTKINSLCNAIARQASLALRSGTNPQMVIKSLLGNDDGDFLMNSKCGRATSIPDAVALALQSFIGDNNANEIYDICPMCHHNTFMRVGTGCKTCQRCSHSTC